MDYGCHLQAGVGDNSTVAKMDFSGAADQAGTNYTVRSWGGKLTKWTQRMNCYPWLVLRISLLTWRDPSASY